MQLHSASYVIFIWSFIKSGFFCCFWLNCIGGNYFPIVLCLLQHHSSSNIKHPQRLAPGGKQRVEKKKEPVCSCILSLSNRIPQKGSIFLHLPRSTGPSNRVKHQKKAPQSTIIIPIQSCKENVNRQAGLQSCPNFPRRLVIKQKRCNSGKGFLPLVFSLYKLKSVPLCSDAGGRNARRFIDI